jgi:hypothetical protein
MSFSMFGIPAGIPGITMSPDFCPARHGLQSSTTIHASRASADSRLDTVQARLTSVNQKPETRNQKPETRNQKPETRNQKPETRNQKPETRNQKLLSSITVRCS